MTALLVRLERLLARFYGWLHRRPEWLVAAAVIAGCVLLIFGRLLARPNLMIWGSDFVQFYFWEDFTRTELVAGRLPQWNPYFFSGYPALANPQMMTFYPVALTLRLLPLSYAFGLGITLHIGLGGLGMYWLTRRLGLGRTASFVSGVAFMLGGIVVPHITGGHVEWLYTIGWLPWVLLTWQQVMRAPRLDSALFAGATTAMMILGGAFKILLCAGLMVGVLMVVEAGVRLRADADSRGFKPDRAGQFFSIVASAGLGLLIAFGLAAPQLLPSLELASLSSRAAGLPLECANDLSLAVRELLYVGFPRLPFETMLEWERHSYVGAIGFGLAVIGLLGRSRSASSTWKPILIVWGAVGLLLSLGPALPFYPLFRFIPLANLVRQPFTFVVLFSFAGAGLAGLGWEWMAERLKGNEGNGLSRQTTTDKRGRVVRLGAAVWLVIAAIIDIALYQRTPSPTDPSFYGLVNWLAMFSTPRVLLAGVILLWQFGGRRWLTVTAIVGLLYVDLWLFAYGRISFLPATSPEAQAGNTPRVSIAEARVLTTPYTFSDRSMAVLVGNAQGYAPIVVETYRAFNTGAQPQTGCPSFENAETSGEATLLEMLSIRYVIDIDGNVLDTLTPLPRALWIAEVIGVESPTEAIRAARRAGYEPLQKVYVEGYGSTEANGTGSVRITDYQTGSVTLEVESTSDGWVYLNDVWYPGWSATVNGEPQTVYRANGTFRAVAVPAGHSTVVMTFQSTYLNLGLVIGAVTLGVLSVLAIIAAIRSRAQPAAPPAPADSE